MEVGIASFSSTGTRPLSRCRGMSTPNSVDDGAGNRWAAVAAEELEEWAWLLAWLEDWLIYADHDTAANWADFAGPRCGSLDDVAVMLGQRVVRMRRLAAAAQPGGAGHNDPPCRSVGADS